MRPAAQAALQAFRDVERTRFLLDRKEEALRLALIRLAHDSRATEDDRAEYAAATRAVEVEYDEKRGKAGM
jgi:hypothetical protein